MICPKCGAEVPEGSRYCYKCGSQLEFASEDFLIATTPTIPGYKIRKVLGVVTGLVPRTRGFLGKFIAEIQSFMGGEISAFTYELEKARMEAIERLKSKAKSIGGKRHRRLRPRDF
ncbi:hypothetical protein DRO64_02125 [Candidatus Bathyarchaeota archaeon]|nr:MAG: hypothetical protein DRO64_02125 [Candidatus Bathyarchaeota archaeon]